MNYKYVGVNENGARVGETHHRAKLTDHDIDLIRQLHDDGLGYKTIADKFEIGKSTVRDIVKCTRRGQTPSKWRRIETDEPAPPKPAMRPRVREQLHGKVKFVKRGIGTRILVDDPNHRVISKAKMFRFLSVIAEHPHYAVTVKSLSARYRLKHPGCAKELNTGLVLKLALRAGLVRMVAADTMFDPSPSLRGRLLGRRPREWFITEKGLLWLDS